MEYCDMESNYGWEYGVDYVVFGYLSGEETAFGMIAADVGYLGVDYDGTPVEDLPLIQSLQDSSGAVGPHVDASCFKLAYFSGVVTIFDMWVRQWPIAYGMRSISNTGFQSVAPYYKKHVWGVLDGTRGSAEYEKVTGYPGVELMKLDGQNFAGSFIYLSIIVANIASLVSRKKVDERVRI
jgi:hypothetical protein